MAMSPRLLRPRATGFNPKSISGLTAWFDADDASTFTLNGTAVSEWRDKSGNGYAVSQGTSNNQPVRTGTVLGRATIDFDGSNDCLFSDSTGLAASLSGDKSLTAFIVGQMHTTAEAAVNNLGVWFSFGSTSSGTPFLYVRAASDSGNFQLVVRNDASSTTGGMFASSDLFGQAGGVPQSSFLVSVTSPSQGTAVQRAHSIVRSSTTSATNTASASRPAGNITVNRFTVGALGTTSFSDFFPARISEVILYSKALSADERGKMVAWLAKRYNVTTPVI
jgi:hypothetical protein